MIPDPVRLYNPKGPDRVAVVSATVATGPAGSYLIRLARGPRAGSLGRGRVYGPFPADVLAARFDEVVATLRTEGFGPPGLGVMLEALAGTDARARSRAAIRLG